MPGGWDAPAGGPIDPGARSLPPVGGPTLPPGPAAPSGPTLPPNPAPPPGPALPPAPALSPTPAARPVAPPRPTGPTGPNRRPPRRGRAGRLVLLLGLPVAALALIGTMLGRVWDASEATPDVTSPSDATIAIERATGWPDELADLVRFVEEQQGRAFLFPLQIEYVEPEEYDLGAVQHPNPGQRQLTDDEFRQVLDALGFPADGPPAIVDGGVRYETVRESIRVRGDELTPTMRTAMVGALARALLDQHERFPFTADDRAVIAADVARTQDAFVAANPGETPRDPGHVALDQYDSDMPLIVTRGDLVRFGRVAVDWQYARAGYAGVDVLLDGRTYAAMIAPWAPPPPPTPTIVTGFPETPPGATPIEQPRWIGPYELALVLDAWLPWSQARAAVDGIVVATYSSHVPAGGGPACVEVTAAFASDPQPFVDAIAAWAAASGSAASPVLTPDGDVVVSSCADGSVSAPPPAAISTARAVAVEAALVGSLPEGAPPESIAAVLCAARGVIDDPTAGPSIGTGSPDAALVSAALQAALAACGAPADLVPVTDISWMYQQ